MKTIVIVDDSPSVLQMLSAVLSAKGFRVLQAESGEQALQIMDGRHIDLVITDLLMPQMDGVELIRELRRREPYRFVPIMMLTTQSNEEMKREGKAAGASNWIVKPFSPRELEAMVRKTLGTETPPAE